MLTEIILALAITVILEGIAVFAITKSGEWLLLSISANLITNPIVSAFIISGISAKVLVALEVSVFVLEAVFYYFLSERLWKRCFKISLIANIISFILGSGIMRALQYYLL